MFYESLDSSVEVPNVSKHKVPRPLENENACAVKCELIQCPRICSLFCLVALARFSSHRLVFLGKSKSLMEVCSSGKLLKPPERA